MSTKEVKLSFDLADIQVRAVFTEGFNVFDCESGIGKTRALEAISTYCELSGIKAILINYDNYEYIQWHEIKGYRFVLLNNSDLYLTKEIRFMLCKNNSFIISDVKDNRLTAAQSCHHCTIKSDKDLVVID